MQIVANNVNCFFGAYIGKLKDTFCKNLICKQLRTMLIVFSVYASMIFTLYFIKD